MTRRNSLSTIHEPFGDAFYYGPERMGTRFENDEKSRKESGFANSTYREIFERIQSEAAEVRLPRVSCLHGSFLCLHTLPISRTGLCPWYTALFAR